MAEHQLIATQLEILADRLPGAAVDELADGLWETYGAHLARTGDPEAAGRATIAEFGDADTVIAAYLRYSPWRRAALALLVTGPFVGVLWAITLVTNQVWDWPIPAPARILYGVILVGVVLALMGAVHARHAYSRARVATVSGAAALVLLDISMLATTMALGLDVTQPLALAVAAGLIRALATVRMIPALIHS